MFKFIILFFLILLFGSCSVEYKKNNISLNEGVVEFEFLDSLIIESIYDLYLADKCEHTQQLLFNEKQFEELLITDIEGNIVSSFIPKGEGPNKVESPLEVAFWQEGIVIKEISSEHKFNFYNHNFGRLGQSPAISKGLNFISISNSHRSFSVFELLERSYIAGKELNLVDEELLNEDSENWRFYENANIGYIYDVDSENLILINLYPKTWKIRLEKKWVGRVTSYLQVSKNDNIAAVLPSVGDEIFFFEINNTLVSPLFQISLIHPERKYNLSFNPKNDYVLYPFFSQLFSGGNYFLVEFYTELPQEIYDSFRAKGEGFHMDPEYWSIVEKYRKVKYILTDKNGNQAAISELPIIGAVHFMDANDILYVKRTSEEELDYNVFYRYKVTLK